ncbi:hypothetical protein E1B28_011498 [Marasmius oreades]|uniref:Uncharacterized protein n=1 Tax=Marasmius oreades TaxID=181124 RepID=A0A9P7US55_9AGAR|nr:uncharacterized protein E1B28_011498 [Marasmius oreades]KAG7089854.1 hypothetical protein E1B28_011498 [Marasmius oreades]
MIDEFLAVVDSLSESRGIELQTMADLSFPRVCVRQVIDAGSGTCKEGCRCDRYTDYIGDLLQTQGMMGLRSSFRPLSDILSRLGLECRSKILVLATKLELNTTSFVCEIQRRNSVVPLGILKKKWRIPRLRRDTSCLTVGLLLLATKNNVHLGSVGY